MFDVFFSIIFGLMVFDVLNVICNGLCKQIVNEINFLVHLTNICRGIERERERGGERTAKC